VSAPHGRLHDGFYWGPASASASEYIEFEFESEEQHVVAVALQGSGPALDSWLTSFKIAYSTLAEPAVWLVLKDSGHDAVLSGSDDADAVVLVDLNTEQWRGGLRAKRLRIYPQTWASTSSAVLASSEPVGARFEVYRGVCAGAGQAGVAFGQNQAHFPSPKLVSVGLRNSQGRCRAGWAGDGVQCVCPAASSAGVLAYWRFEPSPSTEPSSRYWHVADVASRGSPAPLGARWFDEGGVRNERNHLQLASRGERPSDQVYIRSAASSLPRRGPRNIPWALLCLDNHGHLALPGSRDAKVPLFRVRVRVRLRLFVCGRCCLNKVPCDSLTWVRPPSGPHAQVGRIEGLTFGPFLQTLPHAALNSHQLSSFTIEMTVYLERQASRDMGEICLLERPSPTSASILSSGSSVPSSRDCPAIRLLLTPSNRLLLTWSSPTNASNASASSPGSAWKLAGPPSGGGDS